MAENEQEPGKMDTTAQEKTFAGFMRYVVNGSIIIVLLLIFLAIFAT